MLRSPSRERRAAVAALGATGSSGATSSCWGPRQPHHVFRGKDSSLLGKQPQPRPRPWRPLPHRHHPATELERVHQQRASRSWRWAPGSDWPGPLVKYFKYHSLPLDLSAKGQKADFLQKALHLPLPASLSPLPRVDQFRIRGSVFCNQMSFSMCKQRSPFSHSPGDLGAPDCKEILLCASSFYFPNLFIPMKLG